MSIIRDYVDEHGAFFVLAIFIGVIIGLPLQYLSIRGSKAESAKESKVVQNEMITKFCEQVNGEVVCTARIEVPRDVNYIELAVLEVGSNQLHFIREVKGYCPKGIKIRIDGH